MPKKPKIALRQVRAISRMLTLKNPVEKIVTTVKVSRTTIERVRADYNAITFQAALNHLDPDEYLADPEYKQAAIRARGVDPTWRTAIIKGISDTIKTKDIIDDVPRHPLLAFAPQKIDPEHDSVVLLAKLRGQLS